ncbi:NUDIX hydrolase [Arthrobacter sp. ISL-48]|uniref:NUDIX hydrolase n=1 Tax=Arthrobacter sp. ISL-48 TaxID=2819110 RepID=UPI001BEC26B3|nr:NUDIX hydrolase [Arthrobacter sp. ISL-48]MBT2533020.1 NUDIX hydrolase [Arthrobacter sp. ISL-48]
MDKMSLARPWTRLGSETAHNGFVRVRRDVYRTADGSVSSWDVLEERNSVAVVAFTHDLKGVVVFDQFRVGPQKVLIELPGGGVEDGEDVEEGGRRELLEETGYQAAAVFHAGSEWASANSSRRKHVIIAAGCARIAPPTWDDGEMGQPHEMPAHEFITHLLGGNLTDAGLAMRGLHFMARTADVPPSLLAVRGKVRELLAGP